MLSSLEMMNLMAAASHYPLSSHHHHPLTSHHQSSSSNSRLYNSSNVSAVSTQSISTSDPLANECKLIDYRGQKVAAFTISSETMLCLPQAVELFLKDAVGGPHTVYCKLKRLDIEPLVCNVEQVRILRALGAIQPFVNRCKLLSVKDFDSLYDDCTTKSSSKAGRPAKKIFPMSSSDLQHLQQYKKYRIENNNGNEYSSYDNDTHVNKSPNFSSQQLNQLALMQLNHQQTLMHSANSGSPNGFPPVDVPMMMKAAMKAGMSPGEIEAIARSGLWGPNAYEEMIRHLERYKSANDEKRSNFPEFNSNKPTNLLNLSKNNHDPGSDYDASNKSESPSPSNHDSLEDNVSEYNNASDDDSLSRPLSLISHQSVDIKSSPIRNSIPYPENKIDLSIRPDDPGTLSVGALLWNIHALMQVAADNARQHEKETTNEKAELKMDILREREVKDSLERQLVEERKLRLLYQKRYSRERKLGYRLRNQVEKKKKLSEQENEMDAKNET